MEPKNNIKKTMKNSLDDVLDIKKRKSMLDYVEEASKKVIHIDSTDLQKIEESTFSKLEIYMNNTFIKFNMSPIMNKIFPNFKTENEAKLAYMNFLWKYYCMRIGFVIHKAKANFYTKKIFQVFVSFVNKYLKHIFGIPKIYEAFNILNKKTEFKINDFSKENETKDIYLNIENELKGAGCTFIFLKELRRLFDCLIYSQEFFKMSIYLIFCDGFENFAENIFYEYVIENEAVSSLLYQIKLIFQNYSEDKHVVNLINKFTIENKKELKQKEYYNKIKDIYSMKEYDERVYAMIFKEFEEVIKFKLNDEIPKKINYEFKEVKDLEKDYKLNGDEIEFKEDEKVNQIKDLDELVKYIQGEKKKKKKKKKKENPFNKLEKFNNNNNMNLDDDQMSIISHDTIFSTFKADIRNDNIDDEDLIKIKPMISDKFIENLK